MTAPIFSPAGVAALRGLVTRRALLCFDLDGTLAPIVEDRNDARVAPSTARLLSLLTLRWPVAVLTGRARADARPRLGFEPRHLVGNHGAERGGDADADAAALQGCRDDLAARAASLAAHGIEVEDKGLSIALHYRRSRDASAALGWLSAWAGSLGDDLRAESGHFVSNVMPAGAGDKGGALRALLSDSHSEVALVVGDDTNDEPAFRAAPPGSVTLRVGDTRTATTAAFGLERQSEIDALLQILLWLDDRATFPASAGV